jgi:hypothetical protein
MPLHSLAFPDPGDDDFYDRIAEKKEYRIHELPKISGSCSRDPGDRFRFHAQQLFLSNYIHPETAYMRILVFHGTGVGKTYSTLAIAENFRDVYWNSYQQGSWNGQYIYILASEESQSNYRSQYRFRHNLWDLDDRQLKARMSKPANGGFIRFMGYLDFVNRCRVSLGMDALNSHGVDPADLESYRKKPIRNLDHCVLIVDEAHRVTGENTFHEAIMRMVDSSRGTRVVLATATPMMHKPSEIIDILNFLRVSKVRYSDIFVDDSTLQPDGLRLIRELFRGLVSYLRGNNPYTFPRRVEVGEVLPGAQFIRIVRCPMKGDQLETYRKVLGQGETFSAEHITGHISERSALDIEKLAILNMVLPGGHYSTKDITHNIKSFGKDYLRSHGITLLHDPRTGGFIPTGSFLQLPGLERYSAKYARLVRNLQSSQKFSIIYHRFVNGSGVKLIGQVLAQNGFSQYVGENTQPSKYGAYAILHGELSPTERQRIIGILRSPENRRGEIIRYVVCSEIVKESVDLRNIREIHVMHFLDNLQSLEQVIGRGVRNCSHADLPRDEWEVKIFKYSVSLPEGNDSKKEKRKGGSKKKESKGDFSPSKRPVSDGLSVEEQKYIEKEHDFVVMKKIERVMKESAVDCILNRRGNLFPEDRDYSLECDFDRCQYRCWGISRELPPVQSAVRDTYIFGFYRHEVEEIKQCISDLMLLKLHWTFAEIVEEVRQKIEWVEHDYIVLALDEMTRHPFQGLRNVFGRPGQLVLLSRDGTDAVYGVRETAGSDEHMNEIDISEYLLGYHKKRKEPRKVSWSELMEEVDLIENRDELATILSKFPVDHQQVLLEAVIEKVHDMGRVTERARKILAVYSSYLLHPKQGRRYREDHPSLEDLESYSGSERSSGSFSSGSSGSPDSSGSPSAEDLDLIPKGHFFTDPPRLYMPRKHEWQNTTLPTKPTRELPENDIVVGFIDRDRHNNIVFKVRDPEKHNKFADKRRESKGFVCSQKNDKHFILNILRQLGIKQPYESMDGLCRILETELRRRQRENVGRLRWFYDLFEKH